MAAQKEEDTFAAFKGMGYVSMYMGVPLLPGLGLAALGVFGGFALCQAFGAAGLIWPVLCAAAIMFLKVLCETDNKAMERARWQVKAWLLRLKKGSTVLTVSPNKPESKHVRFLSTLKKISRRH